MSTTLFGGVHILALVISLIYIGVTLFLFIKKKVSLRFISLFMLVIGIISETLKVCTYIVENEAVYGGYLPKTDLPFHLCSIQIILVLIICLTKNEGLKKLLYSFMLPTCLIGGVAALILATASSREMWIISIQYFLYHATIIVFAVYLLVTKEIEFEFKDYLGALALLFGMFFVAIYLNSMVCDYIHNINFMYVVNPPQDGLPFLNKDHGWLVYIIHYALLAIICVSLCYIKPIIKKISSLKKERIGGESNN